jgi:PleD family two-component response regulator
MMAQTSSSASLSVMAIADDRGTIELMARVLERSGDALSVATNLAEGLARTAAEVPDIVFVDVSLGRNAGLAVVHHLRAVAPTVSVYAMAQSDKLELGTQAVSLGGAGLVMLPLSGDELLTVLADVRARRSERQLREQLEHEAARSRQGASLLARMTELADSRTRREAAESLAELMTGEAGAKVAIVYLPAGEGSRQLVRTALRGGVEDAPSFCDEMELLGWANRRQLEVIRLALRKETAGLLLVDAIAARDDGGFPLLGLLTAQAATAFALIAAREQSHRGAMKDPSSSAYTFAYFVDVAGREIDKARRHDRRFALATIGVEVAPGSAADEGRSASVETAEGVLSVLRDTDVLARVDEQEFYLLMPETGALGAHSARRRVLHKLAGSGGARLGGAPGIDVSMGVAAFPHDGTDLSTLLRIAKHRAEASRRSVVRRLELDRLPLAEMLDALLWGLADGEEAGEERPRSIELPGMDLIGLALTAIAEALRGGRTLVVCTQRPGMSIGSAARAALGREREDVRFFALDVNDAPGCTDLEVLAVLAQHGAYALIGRTDRGLVRAVHAADPLLADLLAQRLGEAAGTRVLE